MGPDAKVFREAFAVRPFLSRCRTVDISREGREGAKNREG
jgi:hypothetical protein